MDEPTNGLDPIGIAEVRNFIKDLSVDRGKTILISSHILSEIADVYKRQGLSDHRKNHVAFIFQAYNLIDYLTPSENVSCLLYTSRCV